MQLYYLAFQRAPPCAVTPGSTVQVAPTIVNDLRDDVFEPALHEEQDDKDVIIILQWVATSVDGKHKALADGKQGIVWSGATTSYRPVTIAVPSSKALSGSSKLRLALFMANGKKGYTFDLASLSTTSMATADGSLEIVPCLSDDVSISKCASPHSSEKSNIVRRVFCFGEQGKTVCVAEQSGYALDKHLWDASLHLSSWLIGNEGLQILKIGVPSDQPLRIIELGAGTGLLSILVGAELQRACSIVATDLADALPLLHSNIAQNSHLFGKQVNVSAAELDWEQASQSEVFKSGCDLVLVSDCTYNPAYFSALAQTIAALLSAPASRATRPFCLLAKKHRHADEDALWPMLASQHLCSKLVHGREAISPSAAGVLESGSHSRTGWGLYRIETLKR